MSSRSAERSVLFVSNFLSPRVGSRSVTEDLAERLAARGWSVLAASREENRARRLLDMVLTAYRRGPEFRLAIVDVFSGAAFVWAEAVCLVFRRSRKPYVLTLHGGALPEFSRRWPRRVRRLLSSASAVTAPSRYLPERLGLREDRYRLLPNPLDVGRYRFRLRDRPRPHLVWLRAFHGIYNPALALQVLSALRRHREDATLTMVGPDKRDGTFEAVRRLAKELGVQGSVRFTGPVEKPDVPGALDSADVFLNTTNVDNTPVSVLEAMASGLCVVSTNVGGIPYLLSEGEDALLVPPRDPESMARAVLRILDEPGLAARLSSNARTRAESCDFRVVLCQWEALLTEVSRSSHA